MEYSGVAFLLRGRPNSAGLPRRNPPDADPKRAAYNAPGFRSAAEDIKKLFSGRLTYTLQRQLTGEEKEKMHKRTSTHTQTLHLGLGCDSPFCCKSSASLRWSSMALAFLSGSLMVFTLGQDGLLRLFEFERLEEGRLPDRTMAISHDGTRNHQLADHLAGSAKFEPTKTEHVALNLRYAQAMWLSLD